MVSCWVCLKGIKDRTFACGWPDLRSKVLSAPLYTAPQYANSAIAVLAWPVTRVVKYVSLASSGRDWQSIAHSNPAYHSCHCRGSPLYCDYFHLNNWSLFLQVTASANALIVLAFLPAGVKRDGPPPYNDIGAGYARVF